MGFKDFLGLASTDVHRNVPITESWNDGIELVRSNIDRDEVGQTARAHLDNIKLSGGNIGEAGDVRANIGHLAYVSGLGVAQSIAHEVFRSANLSTGLREGVEGSLEYTRVRMNHLESQLDEVLENHRNAINGLGTETNLRLREMEATPNILQTYKSALGDIQDNLARQETFAAEGLRQLSREAAVVIPRPGVPGSIEALTDLTTKTSGTVLRYAMTLHENVQQRLQQLEGHGDVHRHLAIEGAHAADHAQDTATRALDVAARNQGRVDVLSGDFRQFKERTEQALAQNEIRGNAVEGLTARVNEVNQHNIDNRVALAVQGATSLAHTEKLEVHSNDLANLKARTHDLKATSDRHVDKLADHGAELRNLARRVENLEGLHVTLAALTQRISALETARVERPRGKGPAQIRMDELNLGRDRHTDHGAAPGPSNA